MRALGVSAILAVCAVLCAGPGPARADEPQAVRDDDDTTRDRARALFREGVRLTDELQWAEALDAFRASYRIRPAPVVLLNIGIALRALGRNVEAEDSFTRFLRIYGGQRADFDATAQRYLGEVRARIARLRVRTRPARVELTLDGRPVAGERDGPDVVLRVDPGEHFVGARARGYAPTRRAVQLAAGTDDSIALILTRVESSGGGGGPSGWLFVGIGAGVAAIAGGVVLAIVLSGDPGQYPQTTYAAAGR